MAGRNRPIELPSLPLAPPPHHHQSAIADYVAALKRDLQALLLENQRLTNNHMTLKQELSSTHQDLRHLAAISQKIMAERDAEFREVLEKSVKVEAEFRAIEALNEEFTVVNEGVEKLKVEEGELGDQLKVVNGDLAKAKSKLSGLPAIRAEKKFIAHCIEKARAALEVERKNREINLKHGLAKMKKKASLIEEIDSLQSELTLAKKKAKAAAAAANAVKSAPSMLMNPRVSMYGSYNMSYGGRSYPVQNPIQQHQTSLQGYKMEAALEESKKANDDTRTKGSNENQGRANSPPTTPAQSAGNQAKPYRCFNCGDPFHPKKDCNKPPRICHNCGKEGHIAVYCRAKPKGNKIKEQKTLCESTGQNPVQSQQPSAPGGKRKWNENATALAGTQGSVQNKRRAPIPVLPINGRP